MLKLALITLAILAFCMIFLAINIILKKGKGEFRSQHIGQNAKLREHDIHCVQSMDARDRKSDPHAAVRRERGQ
ncbi:MAG: hypothetical protein SPF56_02440 [Bacteroidaceae bacterium]|nr:hypothetical protein [Bacteroidaceae bacterium]